MFTHTDYDGKIVVTIEGNLDEESSPGLREYMTPLIDGGSKYFVLDMSKVFYAASCGLGVLCELRDRLEDVDGWIRFANASEDLIEVFRFVMLDELFPSFDNIAEALNEA